MHHTQRQGICSYICFIETQRSPLPEAHTIPEIAKFSRIGPYEISGYALNSKHSITVI